MSEHKSHAKEKALIIVGMGFIFIGIGTEQVNDNSTSILPPLPPQVDSFLHFLFGAGWWVWLLASIAIAGLYLSKRGFRKEVTRDESKDVDMPTAEQYVGEGKEEPKGEVIREDEEARREREWGKHDWTKPDGLADPSVIKINGAVDNAKQRLIDKLIETIDSLQLKVVLPETQIRAAISTPALEQIEEE